MQSSSVLSIYEQEFLKISMTNSVANLLPACEILERLFNNILADPLNSNKKIFNMENKVISSKVMNIKGIQEFLKIIGYIPYQNNTLIYDGNSLNPIKEAREITHRYCNEHFLKDPAIIENENAINSKMMLEKQEKEKILRKMEFERKEKSSDFIKDSIGNQMKFGAVVNKLELPPPGRK